jgi:tight adherence protein B
VRRYLLVALTAVAAATCAAAARADIVNPTITPVARLRFPERGYLVGLPQSGRVRASDVVVRENGQPVSNPSFVPVDATAEHFGVLLAIDASESMRGAPLADAFTAAQKFTDRLLPKQRIGLITFNSHATLVQRPTTNSRLLARALRRRAHTAQGTHIYDALAEALGVVQKVHLSGASIVLLSDGADTGSVSHETQLVTRARRMHVRIFTIGLRSAAFSGVRLQRLAEQTGAKYAEATTSASLSPIFDQLGRTFASEYFLRYRSQANAGTHVVVTVQIRGQGRSALTYLAPKLAPVAPFHRSIFERFWGSTVSLLVMSLFAAALVMLAAASLLRRTPSSIGARIAEFATLVSEQNDPAEDKPLLSERLFGGTERSLARTRWWTNFREELALADIELTAEQILGLAVVGTLIVGLLLYQASPLFSVFAFAVPFLVRSYCRFALRKVRLQFEEQLPDNLQVLASALRAGHSFVGALSVVAADSSEPSKREFTQVVADEQLGVPLEDSLREVARRMASSDLEQVALVAELQRQTGGNMAEVLERVIDTIRGRFDLRRLVRTLTAQGRMARWILTLLPAVLAAFISLLNPHYIAPLFTTSGGQIVLTIAIVMVILGSLAIKRIVDIRV